MDDQVDRKKYILSLMESGLCTSPWNDVMPFTSSIKPNDNIIFSDERLRPLYEQDLLESIKVLHKIKKSSEYTHETELIARYLMYRMTHDIENREKGYDYDEVVPKLIPLLNENERLQWVFKLMRIYPAGLFVPVVFGSYLTGQYVSIFEDLFGSDFIITLYSCLAVDRPVLLTGETGTGKELFAKAIHFLSDRRDKPFVAVNTSGLPASLLESDLFGHKKGAFTGAINQRAGYFKEAEEGTLFLDEIGDMPIEAQTRLLRVLSDKKFIAVGADASDPQQFKARIICATNKDIPSLIKENKFRSDLYYRISTFELALPSLRNILKNQTGSTTHDLFHASVRDVADDMSYQGDIEITHDATTKLSSYPFPGNYRELQDILTRSIAKMILLNKTSLDIDSIVLPKNCSKGSPEMSEDINIDLNVDSLTYQELAAKIESVRNSFLAKKIAALLHKNKGIVVDAAAEAGFGKGKNAITKFTNAAKKYGINWKDFRKSSDIAD